MKIILLKDIPNVGKQHETKNISDGYAINLLIPKGLAIPATAEAIKRNELEKSREEGERKIHRDLLLKNLKELDGITITTNEKTNEKGHLFAGVHKPEIALMILKQTRLQINSEHIILEKPIKETGLHSIEVKEGHRNIKFNLDIKGII